MISFSHVRNKAFGISPSPNSQKVAQSRTITFATIKQKDENYQNLLYHQSKSRVQQVEQQNKYFCISPLKNKLNGKENSSNNPLQKEECNKFSRLLQKKGIFSSKKKQTHKTFAELKERKQQIFSQKKQKIQSFGNFAKNQTKQFSQRELESSLQKLKSRLYQKQKKQQTPKYMKQQAQIIEFDSFLSDIEYVNASKEDDTVQFDMSPAFKNI